MVRRSSLSPGETLFRALVDQPAAAPEAHLRRYIIERGLRPGDRLPGEHDLAAATGRSRIVVRQALHALEAVGLLESRVGSGWYLRAFDVSSASRTLARTLAFHPSAVLDLLAVWRPAEAALAIGLPTRLSTRDLSALEKLAARMKCRAARSQPFWSEDGEFHRRLVAASGNAIALALVDLYWGIKEALYSSGFPLHAAQDAEAVAEAHGQIVAALRAGDGHRVARLLHDHHAEAERRFASWLSAHTASHQAADTSSLLPANREKLARTEAPSPGGGKHEALAFQRAMQAALLHLGAPAGMA